MLRQIVHIIQYNTIQYIIRQTASYNHLKVLTSGQAQAQHQYFSQSCTGICVSVNQEKPIYDLYQLVSSGSTLSWADWKKISYKVNCCIGRAIL